MPTVTVEPIRVNGAAHTRTTTTTYMVDRALPLSKTIAVSSGEPVRT